MASIYSSGQQVIIWLGRYRELEDDELLFDRETWGFDSLEPGSFETSQKAFELTEYAAVHDLSSAWRPKSSSPSPLNTRYCGYLRYLLNRKWFSRLLVFQEVNMAQQAVVLCGCLEIDWSSLAAAGKKL